MTAGIPPRTVAGIAFIGRGGGAVKTLRGFRKGAHTVPDAVTPATQAFLGRLCALELAEEGERFFQAVRTALKYKRADLSLSVSSPTAMLTAKDFVLEITYALDAADPSRYATATILRELRDADLARAPSFDGVFAGCFSELSFALSQGVRVEAVIDAIEGLEADAGLVVSYPSDYRECEVGVPGVDARVRCTPPAIDLLFPRSGSPAELIDAFAAVRSAFAISPPLRQLIP